MNYIKLPNIGRLSENKDDWGDKETIGKHLKRRDRNFYEQQFAIFLKLTNKGQILLGLKDDMGYIYEYVRYESIDEAKKEWVLD